MRPSIEPGAGGADNRSMRLRFWLGFAVAATIAVGSIVLALVVHGRERDSFETRQQGEATRAAHQAEALATLSVGQLNSAVAFYQAEGSIADSLLNSGGLAATGFLDSVPLSQRGEFELRHGYPIRERDQLGRLRPAGRRASYFPLVFAETVADAPTAVPIGYDIGSDLLRGRYVRKALASGRPAATPVMRLPAGGVGINVFLPVYRDGAQTVTGAQRRRAVTSLAVGSFHVPDLARAATSALPNRVEASLVERGRSVAGAELPTEESATASIRIADRSWLLVVRDPTRPGLGLAVAIVVFGLSMAALLAALVLVWSRSERMHELARQAGQDPLTGLYNRRRFEQELRAELARSHRYGIPGALLMLDLDHFKQVNDTLGHQAGDRVLAEIAAVLRGRARETDLLARLGGDEFAVVLPRCSPNEAEEVAGEIAAGIQSQMDAEAERPPLTASVGIAPFGTGVRLSYESVLAQADAAMYAAKQSGGDRVRVFDPRPEPDPVSASDAR
jgi:diguanylate cyclase (GGDEF)-like protein